MMKKPYIIGGIFLVIVILTVLYIIGSGEGEPILVQSADGSAVLEFDKKALPKGVSGEDISISRIADEEVEGTVAAYRLEPEGLRFASPAAVTVAMPEFDGKMPVGYLESGGIFEVLSGTEATIRNGELSFRVPISHFSLLIIREGPFRVSVSPLDGKVAQEKDGKFKVRIDVLVPEKEWIDSSRGWKYVVGTHERGALNGIWHYLEEGGVIVPFWSDRLQEDFLNTESHESEFTCNSVGEATLYFEGDVTSYGKSSMYISKSDVAGSPSFDPEPDVVSNSMGVLLKFYVDVTCEEPEEKKDAVRIVPEDAVQPEPFVPQPPTANKCEQVCGQGRVKAAESLNQCSDTSGEFLCIQNKLPCYDYIVPAGWQNDSGCCCVDPYVQEYAGGRIDCSKFVGWDFNGFAVTKSPAYPFGEATKPASECQ